MFANLKPESWPGGLWAHWRQIAALLEFRVLRHYRVLTGIRGAIKSALRHFRALPFDVSELLIGFQITYCRGNELFPTQIAKVARSTRLCSSVLVGHFIPFNSMQINSSRLIKRILSLRHANGLGLSAPDNSVMERSHWTVAVLE